MPVIVACPSCGGKLRVGDALLGQKVRCPACRHTFESTAPQPSPPAPQDLPLQLSLDDPSSPPSPAPSAETGGLIGAIEIKSSKQDEPTPPPRLPKSSPPDTPPPSEPPRRSASRWAGEQEYDWEMPDLRRRQSRRDAEPDRGAIVLSLGIISLACLMVWCAPVGVLLGLAAWIMGQSDLRKMKSGLMDVNGRGMTRGGWICGILGVVLNGLITLGCGGLIGFIWYNEMSRPPNTQPIPIMRPAPPRPQKGGFPPPQNPPPRKF